VRESNPIGRRRMAASQTLVMPHTAPRVLATRISKTLTDTLEILCLERGLTKAYRLYTTTDEGLSQFRWDLDPVEFNRTDEPDLNTYLIESFWLTRISPGEIHSACDLYEQGIFETSIGEANQQSTTDLGSLGVLLIEMFNRIQTINPKEAHSTEVLEYIDSNLSKLESLPSLPVTVQTSLHGCRLVYREILAESVMRNRKQGH
jgi:hypothetical protein